MNPLKAQSAVSVLDKPVRLCTTCKSMFHRLVDVEAWLTGDDHRIEHQTSLPALEARATQGCDFCNIYLSFCPENTSVDLSSIHSIYMEPYVLSLDVDIAPVRAALMSVRMGLLFSDGRDAPLVSLSFERSSEGVEGILGRWMSASPDIELARHWIDSCSRLHHNCPTVKDRDLPTRLIDVGLSGSVSPVLVCTRGQKGRYAALSHCWGSPSEHATMTQSSNKEAFQTKIPFELLAKNFQDAIITTQNLGLGFLWIDCLCIVQDDAADWQRECARMATVYENAVLTIAASDASTSATGFLDGRRSRRLDPRYATVSRRPDTIPALLIETGNSVLRATIQSNYDTFEAEENQIDSPLNIRAWVLQERIMSRRILSFCGDQMVFECDSCIWYESCHFPILSHRRNGTPRRPSLADKRLLHTDSADELLERWYSLLAAYASCSITKGDDRLPALSGIASRIQERTKDVYVAGLWKRDLVRGLSWSRTQFQDHRSATHAAQMWVPSWSWAACEFEFRPQAVRARTMAREAEVVDVATTPLGLDPFGQVASAGLSINGFLREVEWRRDGVSQAQSLFSSSAAEASLGGVYFDKPLHNAHPPGTRLKLYCLLLLSGGTSSYAALILESLQSPVQSFRRIGLLWMDLAFPNRSIEARRDSLTWLRDCERRTVHLV